MTSQKFHHIISFVFFCRTNSLQIKEIYCLEKRSVWKVPFKIKFLFETLNFSGKKLENLKFTRRKIIRCDFMTKRKKLNFSGKMSKSFKKRKSIFEGNKLVKSLINSAKVWVMKLCQYEIIPFKQNSPKLKLPWLVRKKRTPNRTSILVKKKTNIQLCPKNEFNLP